MVGVQNEEKMIVLYVRGGNGDLENMQFILFTHLILHYFVWHNTFLTFFSNYKGVFSHFTMHLVSPAVSYDKN